MTSTEYKEKTGRHTYEGNNQDILNKFVGLHVGANVNSLMEYVLNDDCERDEIDNMYLPKCSECGEFIKGDIEDGAKCPECGEANEAWHWDSEAQEVYQWFIIDNWIFDKLKERGEVVYDAGSCCVWGRGCCGQAILLDGIIVDIALELEILEGQRNDWSPKRAA